VNDPFVRPDVAVVVPWFGCLPAPFSKA
jgi:hypothetical protein